MNDKSSTFRMLIAAVVLGTATSLASAQLPTANDLFAMRTQNSANDNNFATGDVLYWGIQDAQASSWIYGTTRQCPTGATCSSLSDPDLVRQSLIQRPYSLLPDQYFASRPYDPTLTNPWTLVLSSTPNYASGTNTILTTPAVGSVNLMPFVQSMSVQGAGLAPTINWQLPDTTGLNLSVDRVNLFVFDRDSPVTATDSNTGRTFQQSDFIFNALVPQGQNSFQIPQSANLQYGNQYSIAVAVQDLRPDGTVESRSLSFFDFTPLNTGSLNVYLPTFVPVPTSSGLTAGPLYGFNIGNVSANQVTYIDPLVATGFTFTKGATDPNFKSVLVVSNIGDGLYDVYAWDGTNWFLVKSGLAVNETWNFSDSGVEKFQIRGIETAAELNPFDITGFVTGLTFVADGSFTGTMQAMITDTSTVPEPATLILTALGLLGILVVRRRV